MRTKVTWLNLEDSNALDLTWLLQDVGDVLKRARRRTNWNETHPCKRIFKTCGMLYLYSDAQVYQRLPHRSWSKGEDRPLLGGSLCSIPVLSLLLASPATLERTIFGGTARETAQQLHQQLDAGHHKLGRNGAVRLMSLRVCRSKESWTALMRLRILSTKLKALPLDKPTGSLELLPSHKSWHWNAEPVSKISLRYARLSESHHSNDWRTEALCVFCWHFLLIGLVVLSYLLLDGSVVTSQDMLRRTKDIMVAGSKLSVPWLHRSTGLSFETLFFLLKLNHVSLGLTSGLEFKDLLTRYNWHMFFLETGRSSRWKNVKDLDFLATKMDLGHDMQDFYHRPTFSFSLPTFSFHSLSRHPIWAFEVLACLLVSLVVD